MQKFETLRQPLLGFWITVPPKEEEETNVPKIVATFVYASSQGQRTHSARTNIFTPVWPSSLPLHHMSEIQERFYIQS